MRTPICEPCGRGDKLCAECQARLGAGRISALDVEVSRILYKINEAYNITAAEFSHAVDAGGVVLIFTPGEMGLLIGRQGKVVSSISTALGRKVRIIPQTEDVRKTISDVIAPARLLGINNVFHAGQEVVKVRVPRADQRALRVDEPTLTRLMADWVGKPVQLVFE